MTPHNHTGLLLVLACLPVPAWANAPEPVPRYAEFKAWQVGCDNTRRCTAVSASTDTPGMGLEIFRDAGPGGATRLSVFTPAGLRLHGDLGVDGHAVPGVRQAQGQAAIDLLRRLRNADTLDASSNQGERHISLQGLSAALLLIDSVQSRLDHPSALVRTGSQPDSGIPAAISAPSLPGVIPAPSLSAVEAQTIGEEVIRLTQDQWSEPGLSNWTATAQVSPLDTAHVLVGLRYGCDGDNCMYSYYRAARTAPYQPTVLAFITPPYDDLGGEMYGQFIFDAGNGELTQLAAHGAGCGTRAVWAYDGTAMQLKEFRSMRGCQGLDPARWPVIWRTATQATPSK